MRRFLERSLRHDYGWLAAQDAYARAHSVAGDEAALAPWWLDVEAANSWSGDVITNSADLQGGIDYLRSVNVGAVGIYTRTSRAHSGVAALAGWTDEFFLDRGLSYLRASHQR